MVIPRSIGVDVSNDTLSKTLAEMHAVYQEDPVRAVRGQHFIKALHRYIADGLRARLHPHAVHRGVRVVEEAMILGSHKPKSVDIAVIHPGSGPLVLIGVKSQMSSIGKNVLNYYQDIVGEAVSLQERYPMSVHGYAYLHPLRVPKTQSIATGLKAHAPHPAIDVARYARMYRAITGRDDRLYRTTSGIYDEFAYLVVDFDASPISLRDDLVVRAVDDVAMSGETFVERIIATYQRRNIWFDLFT